MSSGTARCDQIVALIDACLSEIRAGDAVPMAAPHSGTLKRESAAARAARRWAGPSEPWPVPRDAA
jgi:hypothetical protein